MKTYDCGRCRYASESYRAVGNTPEHAHLCKACFEELPESMKEHYINMVGPPMGNLTITQEQAKECLRRADEALAKLRQSGWPRKVSTP